MTASKTFTFKHAGKEYSLPLFSELPVGVLRAARKGTDDMDKVFIVLEKILPEGAPELEAIDIMSPVEFNDFLLEWTQGAPLGESSNS